jgi:hypothetical protein
MNQRQMRSRWVTQFVSLGFTEHDRYLSATPLYFGGGRSLTMSSCATTTLLVPTILRRMLAEGQVDGEHDG